MHHLVKNRLKCLSQLWNIVVILNTKNENIFCAKIMCVYCVAKGETKKKRVQHIISGSQKTNNKKRIARRENMKKKKSIRNARSDFDSLPFPQFLWLKTYDTRCDSVFDYFYLRATELDFLLFSLSLTLSLSLPFLLWVSRRGLMANDLFFVDFFKLKMKPIVNAKIYV